MDTSPCGVMRKIYFLLAVWLLCCPRAWPSGDDWGFAVSVVRKGKIFEVFVGGKPFTSYYVGPDSPKPYMHPLRTARGNIVTRGFPMDSSMPDEDRDHPHHRAMFFAHGDINGVDFWSEASLEHGALPNGRTVFKGIYLMESGKRFGKLGARFDLVGPDGEILGEESQLYVFSGDNSLRVVDCEFSIRASREALTIGDTKEGTFAIRVVKALRPPGGYMLNSENKSGEKNIWGKRANWVDYSGVVNGEKAGIAIFDHPANAKHPTYWMAREYGLFAVNPFGERAFYSDPSRDGSVRIPLGGVLSLRYRVLIHQGDAREAHIRERYEDYSRQKDTSPRSP